MEKKGERVRDGGERREKGVERVGVEKVGVWGEEGGVRGNS